MRLGSDFRIITREQIHLIRESLQVLLGASELDIKRDTQTIISDNVRKINDLLSGTGGPTLLH